MIRKALLNHKTTHLKISILLTLHVFDVASGIAKLNKEYNISSCASTSNVQSPVPAFVGWPFHISCNDSDSIDQCFISSSASYDVISQTSIVINGSAPIQLVFTLIQHYNNSYCVTTNTTVQLKHLPSRSCFDDVVYAVNNDVNIVNVSRNIKGDIDWDCKPASNAGSDAVLPPSIPSNQYTTRWRITRVNKTLHPIQDEKSCGDLPTRRFDFIEHNNSPSSLSNDRVDFRDPGIYTCEVEYAGKVAYIAHYSLCVANPSKDPSPTLHCEDEITFEEEGFVIVCNAHAGNTKIQPDQMEVKWTKVSEGNICSNNDYESVESSSLGPRLFCGVQNLTNFGTKCFHYEASPDELQHFVDIKKFEIYLKFSKAMKSDEGIYQAKFRYLNQWSNTEVIKLELDPSKHLRLVIAVLATIAATLLVATLIGLLVWYRRFTILLIFRRHFGKYDRDDKLYVVNFCYHLSGEMDSKGDKNTKIIVRLVRETLGNLKYTYYDCNEDFSPGNKVENMLATVERSHRMVVILTDDFIKDDFSRFKAFEGRHNMLENKLKLIVISTPGAMKTLGECVQRGDSFAGDFEEIIKVSRRIKWTDKVNEKEFKKAVEYALPNLPKQEEGQQPFIEQNSV